MPTQLIFEFGTLEAGPDWVHVSYEKDELHREKLRAVKNGNKTQYLKYKWHKTKLLRQLSKHQFSSGGWMFKGNLYPFQEEATELMVDRGQMLLALVMGAGKTVTTIAALEKLFASDEIKKVIVVVPFKYVFKNKTLDLEIFSIWSAWVSVALTDSAFAP